MREDPHHQINKRSVLQCCTQDYWESGSYVGCVQRVMCFTPIDMLLLFLQSRYVIGMDRECNITHWYVIGMDRECNITHWYVSI